MVRNKLENRHCSIWICTPLTEKECLEKNLFGEAEKSPRMKMDKPRKGDVLFLLNPSEDKLWGVFIAISDIGEFDLNAWKDSPFKFPHQIKVKPINEKIHITEATSKLKECGVIMSQLRSGYEVPRFFRYPPEITKKVLALFPDEAISPTQISEIEDEEEKVLTIRPKSGFDRVAGLEPVKQFIMERMVEPLLYPSLAQKYRLRLGGGLLLFGPPGTGKTLIAKATASELEAEFLEISPSIIRGFPGDAEQKLERIFTEAMKKTRIVIFLDEAEALLCAREQQTSTVMQRVVPVLLSLFSRVTENKESCVLIIAATNKPWEIDEAFLRPGRLDARIYVGPPNQSAREELIRLCLEERPHKFTDEHISQLAEELNGWTGADIESLFDKASIECYRRCPKPKFPDDEVLENDIIPLTFELVKEIAKDIKPSLTYEQIAQYKEWNKRYGTLKNIEGDYSINSTNAL